MRVQILPQEGKSCCDQTCASLEWTLTSPWHRRRDRENGVNGVRARNPRSHSVTKRLRAVSKLSVPKPRSLASFRYRSVCQSRSQ